MHEPKDGSSISMAGPMGMVKLFVRTGVQIVSEVYDMYLERLEELAHPIKRQQWRSYITPITRSINSKRNN